MMTGSNAEQFAKYELKKAIRKVARKAIRKILSVLAVPLSIFLLAIFVVVILNNAPDYYTEKIDKWFSEYFGSMDDAALSNYGITQDMVNGEYASSMEYVNNAVLMRDLFRYAEEDIDFGTWQMDYTDLMRIMDAVCEERSSYNLEREATYSYYDSGYNETINLPYHLKLEDTVLFSLANIENDQEIAGVNAYQLRWQEVVALCLMASVETNDTWGYKYSDAPDENGTFSFLGSSPTDRYFLSDDVIDGIINILRYDFSYYYNPITDTVEYYEYEDMEKYAYYPEGQTNIAQPDGLDKKVPAIAPSYIGNTYQVITYPLDSLNTLSSRVITYRPHMYVDALSQYIPNFRFDMYIDILKQLPMCDDIVARYQILEKQYEDTETDTDAEVLYQTTSYEFPSKGVRVGSECISLTPGDYEYIQDENTYAMFYPGLNESFPYNDYIYISRSAMEDSVLVSDHLTVEQIQILINEMYAQARQTDSRHDCTGFLETADGLYRAQEEFGVSVLAILSIVKQEGVLHEDLGQYGYNYFNYGCYEGGVGFTYGGRNGRFLDCKQTFGDDPSECMYQLIKKINHYYFINRHQDTFFLMCFNGFNGTLGSINHSWCPPCKQEDPSFSDPGTGPEGFKCWSNLCASYRLTLYQRCLSYGFFSE